MKSWYFREWFLISTISAEPFLLDLTFKFASCLCSSLTTQKICGNSMLQLSTNCLLINHKVWINFTLPTLRNYIMPSYKINWSNKYNLHQTILVLLKGKDGKSKNNFLFLSTKIIYHTLFIYFLFIMYCTWVNIDPCCVHSRVKKKTNIEINNIQKYKIYTKLQDIIL